MVEEKQEASVDGVEPEQVQARHILIQSVNLQSYLENASVGEGIKKYITFEVE